MGGVRRGHLPPDQVAPNPIKPGLEGFQEQGKILSQQRGTKRSRQQPQGDGLQLVPSANMSFFLLPVT